MKTTLAHITDLHFGKIDLRLAEALLEDLRRLEPTLIVVSGDLTMRARRREYRAAREYLDNLPCQWLCVPGNHDVPTYNLGERLFAPYRRYRRHIARDLTPTYEDDRCAIVGLNTARSFSYRSLDWSRGRVGLAQLARAKAFFARVPERKARIVFAHHPFILPADDPSRGLVGRLNKALAAFGFSSVDLLLAGHLHQSFWRRIQLADSGDEGRRRPLIAVQGSTATSVRLRGEPNAYNAIEIGEGKISIVTRAWDGTRFAPTEPVVHDLARAVAETQ